MLRTRSSRARRLRSRPVALPDALEERVVEDVALLQEQLTLVIDQVAGDLLADQELLDPFWKAESRMISDFVVLVLQQLRFLLSSMALARASFSMPLRLKTFASMTVP